MGRYSGWAVFREGLRGQTGWDRAWRDPDPKKEYDVIIVGGGGHGLATAYYLAKNHGITNVAVVEKGWLGGGNAGRNTTIVRSNYALPHSTEFYEHSLKLWENLSHDLNYNVMFSQRGQFNLFHTPAARDAAAKRANTMRMNGIEADLLDRDAVRAMVPHLDYSENARFPIIGAVLQKRAGTARHDAVAWGFARGADQRGVDILQNCEVTGFLREGGEVQGVETTRGVIRAKKVGVAVAGSTGHVMAMAGIERLPIETHKLQAFVSEPLKPLLDYVVSYGAPGSHFYISQSDKGGMVFGGDLDFYNSYAQRGNLPIVNDVAECAMAIMPCLGRVKLLRHWAGVMDMSMDGTHIMSKTPVDNLYLNAGWCYGGFKATPASGWHFADLIANERPDNLTEAFSLDRFERGYAIDEKGMGPTPKLH
ncbi:UNVERIFIED_CONTAM: hypothetical protein GTU68_061505 [Idotea baltica]|nr:hypothetical protein [Idotea baltica]